MSETTSSESELPELPPALEDRLYELHFDAEPTARDDGFRDLCEQNPDWAVALRAHIDAITMGEDVLGRVREPLIEAPLPERIGLFSIHELLGEGGFGAVYRAEQHDPVERTVALKVLHPRRLDDRSQLRFQAERQTLARMQHKGIAQIYDAGRTDEGLLYFAMEFVNGEPITRFCDAQSLTLEQRLGLFLDVCAAVQHAHQRGVVHRDIKPSNVIVAGEAANPEPKVIDFGVSKLLYDDGGSLATREGALIGTPAYMSPEQANGDPVDTRTDVYALGVLLYELLTSDLPFSRTRLMEGNVAEIVRLLQEEEPRRLSTAFREASDEIESVAARRQSTPAVLRRQLRGDLEWVLRRALAKHPDQRYPSVSALVEDVERYRRREPVTAREPAALYLLRRFVGRHRLAVGLSVAALLAVGLVILGLAWSLDRVDDARRDAVGRGNEAVWSAYSANLVAARAALVIGDVTSARHHLEQAAREHRGWEWRHLAAQCDQALHVFSVFHQVANAFWLDDETIVAYHYNGWIALWDAETGMIQRVVAKLFGYSHAILDREGQRLIADTDNDLVVLDLDSGERRVLEKTVAGGPRDIRSLAFALDRRYFVASRNDGTITRYDTTGEEAPVVLYRGDSFAWEMEFLADGRLVLAGDDLRFLSDGGELVRRVPLGREDAKSLAVSTVQGAIYLGVGETIEKRNLTTGELLGRRVHGIETTALLVDDREGIVYGAGGWQRGRLTAWSLETLEGIGAFHGHRSGVGAVRVSPDGTRVLTAARDWTVRVWDNRPRTAAIALDAGLDARDLAVAPDGLSFGVGSWGSVTVWDAQSLEVELHEEFPDDRLYGFALGAKRIYAAGTRLVVIDRSTGEKRIEDGPAEWVESLATDDDEEWLVGGRTDAGGLFVWSLPDLELRHRIEGSFRPRLRWDAVRGKFLVVPLGASADLQWLDPETGEFVASSAVGEEIWGLGVAGDEIVAAGADLSVIGPAGGVRRLGTESGVQSSGAFSPDGSRIFSGAPAGRVTVWNREGRELLVLGTTLKSVVDLGFVLGDRRLVGLVTLQGAPSYVHVWSAPPMEELSGWR